MFVARPQKGKERSPLRWRRRWRTLTTLDLSHGPRADAVDDPSPRRSPTRRGCSPHREPGRPPQLPTILSGSGSLGGSMPSSASGCNCRCRVRAMFSSDPLRWPRFTGLTGPYLSLGPQTESDRPPRRAPWPPRPQAPAPPGRYPYRRSARKWGHLNEIFIATARQEPGYWAVRILGLLDGQVQVADLAEAEGAAQQLIVSTLKPARGLSHCPGRGERGGSVPARSHQADQCQGRSDQPGRIALTGVERPPELSRRRRRGAVPIGPALPWPTREHRLRPSPTGPHPGPAPPADDGTRRPAPPPARRTPRRRRSRVPPSKRPPPSTTSTSSSATSRRVAAAVIMTTTSSARIPMAPAATSSPATAASMHTCASSNRRP